jgi:hypothetical protein
MSKVITFSRKFPAQHNRAGEPTYFVEAILANLIKMGEISMSRAKEICVENKLGCFQTLYEIRPYNGFFKSHTIREGNRWKVGDKFSPRVWGDDINPKTGRSGPYHSKQIILSDDIEIKKIWKFQVTKTSYLINGKKVSLKQLTELAANDGLTADDLELWFKKPIKGQIICWNNEIEY